MQESVTFDIDHVIPFPLSLWSDGGNFFDWNANGKATCITLVPLLFSALQMQYVRIAAMGFHHQLPDLVPSDVRCNLRTAAQSKALGIILSEINDMTTHGLRTSKGLFIPFIPSFCADIIELRYLLCCSHCPICKEKDEIGNTSSLFQTKDLCKKDFDHVARFESFQSNLNGQISETDKQRLLSFQKEMSTYSEKHHRKLILTPFERIQLPPFLKEMRSVLFPDRMHSLVLNELKYFIEDLMNKLPSKCLNIVQKLSNNLPCFPAGIVFGKKISGITAAMISKVGLLLIVLLYDIELLSFVDDKKEYFDSLDLLESLMLVLCISSKETITKQSDDDDLKVLKDVITKINDASCYNTDDVRVNVHYFTSHFLNLKIWQNISSPRFISSSIGESSIGKLKAGLRSSNKRNEWREDLLFKVSLADMFISASSVEREFDNFKEPNFVKVCMIKNAYLEIGYVDENKNNLYYSYKAVKIATLSIDSSNYKVVASSYNRRMMVTDIINHDNLKLGSYYQVKNANITIKGHLLEDIPESLQEQLYGGDREAPHTKLWGALYVGRTEEWPINDIVGCCAHLDLKQEKIVHVCNHEYSHIVNNKPSVIQVPDCRYQESTEN